ncbi:MAG: hypothetical protein UT11_C0062G0001, partial [Berkelbacteria bacterium GW2011_GWA2_38_9]
MFRLGAAKRADSLMVLFPEEELSSLRGRRTNRVKVRG